MTYRIEGDVYHMSETETGTIRINVITAIPEVSEVGDYFTIGGIILNNLCITQLSNERLLHPAYNSIEDYALKGQVEIITDLMELPRAVFDGNIVTRYCETIKHVIRMLKDTEYVTYNGHCYITHGECCHKFISIALTEAKRAIRALRNVVNGILNDK